MTQLIFAPRCPGATTKRIASCARYVLTLDPIARNNYFRLMKPEIREKVKDQAMQYRADDLANWDIDVIRLYLKNLHRNDLPELNELLNKCPENKANEYRELLNS